MQALRPGDPIDVVAPSSAFDREKFDRGILALRQIGLAPRFRDAIFTKTGHLAGDDARRRGELQAAFRSDSKAFILARGGYGLLRFASELTTIPSKLVIGYSDTTVLHELWRRAGVPSIHGPMCTQLGEDASELQRLQTLLFGELPPPISWTPRTGRKGKTEGPLAGGNLASLASMCGTAEDPAGREDVVTERLSQMKVPLVFGAPFGHAGRNQPVAFGCAHALDADKGTLTPLETPGAPAQS